MPDNGEDRRPVVLVVGSLNVDLLVALERRPAAGETVLAAGLTRRPGGKGANQAAAAAAAGARTLLVGAVGPDADGRALREGLAGQGVDVRLVRAGEDPTGTALVLVTPDGENSIVVVAGANATVTAADVARATGAGPVDAVMAQLEVPPDAVAAAGRLARERAAVFVLNASPLGADLDRVRDELLPWADPVVVNAGEAVRLLGEGEVADLGALAAGLVRRGCASAVVTGGGAGAAWATAAGSVTRGLVPAVPVEVVDTTGAGDAFAGELAAALAGGATLPDAVRAAVAAGAAATRWPGAAPWSW